MLALIGMPLMVSQADDSLAVAPVFGDHMVLQREMKLPIWGTGKAGREVTVTFARQAKNPSRRVRPDVARLSFEERRSA